MRGRARQLGECRDPRSLVSPAERTLHHITSYQHHQHPHQDQARLLSYSNNRQNHKNNTQWHSPLSVSRRGFLESRWSISLHEIGVTPNKVLILPTLCRSPGSLTQASHQNLSDRIEICSPQFLSINLDPEPKYKVCLNSFELSESWGSGGWCFIIPELGINFTVFSCFCSGVVLSLSCQHWAPRVRLSRQDPGRMTGTCGIFRRGQKLNCERAHHQTLCSNYQIKVRPT